MRVSRKPRAEMDARHAAARPKHTARASAPPPTRLNVQQVLDLGNLIFFTFRGRAYGVPPLPYKAGERLQHLWLTAAAFPTPLDATTQPQYAAMVRQLPALLWRHTRPVGLVRRCLRALRLHRNPFRQATERELVDLANFFLKRRMTSSVQQLDAPDRLAPTTA